MSIDDERRHDHDRERQIREHVREIVHEEVARNRKEIQAEVGRQIKALFWAVVILGAALLLAVGIAQLENSSRINDNNASRKDAILQSCQETNLRHDHTIARLRVLKDQQIKNDPRHIRLYYQKYHGTVSLIDALVPHRNCDFFLHSRGFD